MITLPAAVCRSGVKFLLWIQDICIMSKYIYVCVCVCVCVCANERLETVL